VSWAPNIGRSFHLIASTGADEVTNIIKIRKEDSSFHFEKAISLDCGNVEISTVKWNRSGTLLACSSSNGEVLLWKSDFQGRWKRINQNRETRILETSIEA